MNYYFRYFQNEAVLKTADELLSYMHSIKIKMSSEMEQGIREYCEQNTTYPKHIKLDKKTNCIIIKTTSETLEQFHERGMMGKEKSAEAKTTSPLTIYDEQAPGKYYASFTFRRVIVNPDTNKSAYVDETVEAEMFARSQRDCYEQVVAYVQNHPDVDKRSQLPSIKNTNFSCSLIEE